MRADGGSGTGGRPGNAAPAHPRQAEEQFPASFGELQRVIRKACARHTEWQARVTAGIQAALQFAAENPRAARALTVDARRTDSGRSGRQDIMISFFTELLGDVAPAEMRFPISSDRAVVQSIVTVVRGYLIAGMAKQLPDAVPDLVYLTLMPYTGLTEARLWASGSSDDH